MRGFSITLARCRVGCHPGLWPGPDRLREGLIIKGLIFTVFLGFVSYSFGDGKKNSSTFEELLLRYQDSVKFDLNSHACSILVFREKEDGENIVRLSNYFTRSLCQSTAYLNWQGEIIFIDTVHVNAHFRNLLFPHSKLGSCKESSNESPYPLEIYDPVYWQVSVEGDKAKLTYPPNMDL